MKPLNRRAAALFLLAIATPSGLAAAPQEASAAFFANETEAARESDRKKNTLDQQAEYVKYFGTDRAKAALRIYGGIQRKQSTADSSKKHRKNVPLAMEVKGGVAVDALLFDGHFHEVARVGLKTSIDGVTKADSKGSTKGKKKKKGSSSASDALKSALDIQIAGFTVEIPTAAGSDESSGNSGKKKNKKIPPRNILPTDVRAQFTVGPVPVLIRANGGLGTNLEFAPTFQPGSRALVLKGSAEAYLNGWVSAGVGFDCGVAAACAGVKAELRLINVKAELGLGVNPEGWQGDLALELRALTIRMLLFAEAKLAWFKWGWEQSIFQVSFGLVRVEIPFLDTRPKVEQVEVCEPETEPLAPIDPVGKPVDVDPPLRGKRHATTRARR